MTTARPAAILAAAGSGERCRSTAPDPKQFRNLVGRPLFLWSLDVLVAAGCRPIVVVVPNGWVDRVRALAAGADPIVLAGGSTRQESVRRALEPVESERVVVHDAARPCATPELVARTLDALARADAAIAATPVDDTLKRCVDGSVAETVDRTGLWSVHTPQAFVTVKLRAAHRRAQEDGIVATDDAQLIERYGGTVAVVDSPRTNFKITYPEDFALAEAVLGSRA